MYLLVGNHESINMNQMYGFEGETKAKYPSFLHVCCVAGLCPLLYMYINS